MIKDKVKWTGPLALPAVLEERKMYHVQWRNKRIVVLSNAGQLHAFEDRCPHQGASFRAGECKADVIVCPVHRYAFRLDDGLGLNSPGQNIEKLLVEERSEGYFVGTEYSTFSIFGFDLW